MYMPLNTVGWPDWHLRKYNFRTKLQPQAHAFAACVGAAEATPVRVRRR